MRLTLSLLHNNILFLLLFCDAALGESKFEPYEVNGGLVSAVAGKNFCIIAADTRMKASSYLLTSRNHLSSRIWTVNDNDGDGMSIMARVEQELLRRDGRPETTTVMMERVLPLSHAPILVGSSGCTADCRALQSDLRADLRVASHMGQVMMKPSNPNQVATCLSQLLYQRRGFPYYAFCVAAGLDASDGDSSRGHVYVYDAIGSYEQVAVAASGSGKEALQPILDRLFDTSRETPRQVEGTAASAVYKLCQAYRSVSEREIDVGDKLVLHVTETIGNGMVNAKVLVVPLKED